MAASKLLKFPVGVTLAVQPGRAIVDHMKTPIHTTAPSLDDIEEMALAALQVIPDPLRQHVRDVLLRIEDFPDEDTELEMGVETPFDLLGLYRGVAMTNRSLLDVPQDVDMIFLYRRPILDYWCETGEDLQDIVRHVLIHEIGHHFGYSDDDMEAIEERG
ncbi:MAG: metallopeptidase family protein [Oceanibaculum nanhaiense]|uniref:metallopeptidase family protein n=1 Tax=Oceanibaculum nanhaiense TaxID=1909734 RepID=UPI0025A41725|nr:metallopeptidase family protein [Oceanibaculum nanhaiense]MDM7945341.1 metallopeptidase family protein [Oceanibaculum nanhaiense]